MDDSAKTVYELEKKVSIHII